MGNLIDTDGLDQYTDEITTFTSGDSSTPSNFTPINVVASKEKPSSLFQKLSQAIANIRWLNNKLKTSTSKYVYQGSKTINIVSGYTDLFKIKISNYNQFPVGPILFIIPLKVTINVNSSSTMDNFFGFRLTMFNQSGQYSVSKGGLTYNPTNTPVRYYTYIEPIFVVTPSGSTKPTEQEFTVKVDGDTRYGNDSFNATFEYSYIHVISCLGSTQNSISIS